MACEAGRACVIVLRDRGSDAINHGSTGLVWQKEDDGTQKTWEDDLVYSEDLGLGGYDDWRLPNIKELQTVADFDKAGPAIDINYFPNTQPDPTGLPPQAFTM